MNIFLSYYRRGYLVRSKYVILWARLGLFSIFAFTIEYGNMFNPGSFLEDLDVFIGSPFKRFL
jgi:hypothetical protein